MCVRDKVILIESSRTRSERRCDLAHAIAHIELGHHERKNKADERAAVRYAAKMLIDLQELGEALATSCGRVSEEAADLLDVDLETLTVRVQHLHPAEAGYLRRRLSSVVEDAA